MQVKQFEVRPSKIEGYLLDVDHPEGGSKARFFIRRGFHRDRAQALTDALAQHAMQYWPGTVVLAHYRVKHRIIGLMGCPDGTSLRICAIWKVETGSATASLVTAYPT